MRSRHALNTVLVLSALVVHAHGSSQVVATGAQFLATIYAPDFDEIVLTGDVVLGQEDTKPYRLPLILALGRNLTVTSGGDAQRLLDFGGIVDLLSLETSSSLQFKYVHLQGSALAAAGQQNPSLPFEIQGSPLWPTVSGTDKHQVIFNHSSVAINHVACTAPYVAEYAGAVAKLVVDNSSTIQHNDSTIYVDGVLTYPLPVLGRPSYQQVGIAGYIYDHSSATFICPNNSASSSTFLASGSASDTQAAMPRPAPETGGASKSGSSAGSSGTPGWLWPVVGSVLGAAAIGAAAGVLLLLRRRRRSTGLAEQPLPLHLDAHKSLGPLGVSGSEYDLERGASIDAPLARSRSEELGATIWRTRVGAMEGLELGEMLGRGSFGSCYKGRWKGAIVAIKIIEQSIAPGKSQDLSREPLLSSSVSHPNVVTTYKLSIVCLRPDPVEGSSRSSPHNSGGHSPAGSCIEGKEQSAGPTSPCDSGGGKQQAARSSTGSSSPGGGESAKDGQGAAVAEGDVHGGPAGANAQRQPSLTPSVGSIASIELASLDCVLPPGLYETVLVMEMCDRGNLTNAINAGRFVNSATGEIELVPLLLTLLDIALGMEYLHSINIMHGDLKGANCLLKSSRNDRRGYQAKLADFGLSRMLNHAETYVKTKSVGTATHAAPELLRDHRLTKAVDVYAFGIIIWEMVAGEEAYQDLTAVQVVIQVSQHDYRPPLPKVCPPRLAVLMQRCWDSNPEHRPEFKEVVRELREMLMEARQHASQANPVTRSAAMP